MSRGEVGRLPASLPWAIWSPPSVFRGGGQWLRTLAGEWGVCIARVGHIDRRSSRGLVRIYLGRSVWEYAFEARSSVRTASGSAVRLGLEEGAASKLVRARSTPMVHLRI
jgi:hypothetical protein